MGSFKNKSIIVKTNDTLISTRRGGNILLNYKPAGNTRV